MLEVIPDHILSDVGVAPPDDQVPSGADAELAGYVTAQGELAIAPLQVDLRNEPLSTSNVAERDWKETKGRGERRFGEGNLITRMLFRYWPFFLVWS